MGRPLQRTDRDDLSDFVHKRNAICSYNFLEALKANHGDLPCAVEATAVEGLPPIPNEDIAEACNIVFPKFAGRIETIQRATLSEYPKVSLLDLKSQRRTAVIVRARQVAMYLAKTLTEFSFPEIGRRFGGRDHTTVIHAVRKIEYLITKDAALSAQIERIKEIIPEAAP